MSACLPDGGAAPAHHPPEARGAPSRWRSHTRPLPPPRRPSTGAPPGTGQHLQHDLLQRLLPLLAVYKGLTPAPFVARHSDESATAIGDALAHEIKARLTAFHANVRGVLVKKLDVLDQRAVAHYFRAWRRAAAQAKRRFLRRLGDMEVAARRRVKYQYFMRLRLTVYRTKVERLTGEVEQGKRHIDLLSALVTQQKQVAPHLTPGGAYGSPPLPPRPWGCPSELVVFG